MCREACFSQWCRETVCPDIIGSSNLKISNLHNCSKSVLSFFFFFSFLQTFSCVWRPPRSQGYVKCILVFRFPMVWWSFFSLFWLSRQSVYHMESVGRKTVSSVFLIAPLHPHHLPRPSNSHTPFFLPPSPFHSLTAKSAEPNDRKLSSQPNS